MISLLHLNKLQIIIFLFAITFCVPIFAADPAEIWKKTDGQKTQSDNEDNEEVSIESPITSGDIDKITIKIDEQKIDKSKQNIIGIFDPEDNNFTLDMWSQSDGEDIKKILNRINKLKLSKHSENLLFKVLFTNSYSPKTNLNSNEFLKIKISWLIKNRKLADLENLLKINPEVGKENKVINLLINEYLAFAKIKLACEKIKFVDPKVQNTYLDKFTIYCLINDDRKEEAQLIFDLLKERGFKDKFFEDKINYLLGITEKTSQKILDNNLFNFYLSYVTSDNFKYEPSEKTDKYIWKYLSSANLIQLDNLENEDVIIKYEQAAAQEAFENVEIFKIYLKMNFNFNQLSNAQEIYKNLPNYKARALIYQSILLSDNTEKKIKLAFLLKDLFVKDQLSKIYINELSNILKKIDPDTIPDDYAELVEKNLDTNIITKIKFDNDVLHRSKVIKHFLEDNKKINRTEKDFKSVYKKIKKNKKYFISIKDIIVLDSLAADGISIPSDLNYTELSSQLTLPKNLETLMQQKQVGLLMLKIVEIIGEDNVDDLDPETIYFLCKILNELNLKKIRNNILNEALPVRT